MQALCLSSATFWNHQAPQGRRGGSTHPWLLALVEVHKDLARYPRHALAYKIPAGVCWGLLSGEALLLRSLIAGSRPTLEEEQVWPGHLGFGNALRLFPTLASPSSTSRRAKKSCLSLLDPCSYRVAVSLTPRHVVCCARPTQCCQGHRRPAGDRAAFWGHGGLREASEARVLGRLPCCSLQTPLRCPQPVSLGKRLSVPHRAVSCPLRWPSLGPALPPGPGPVHADGSQ